MTAIQLQSCIHKMKCIEYERRESFLLYAEREELKRTCGETKLKKNG